MPSDEWTADQWEREQQEWELDVLNRQRNIVFPDTMLNEGRFFRNMVSGRIPLNPVQRFGILLITAPFIAGGCIGSAQAIGSLVMSQDLVGRSVEFTFVLTSVVQAGFGIIVLVRGLTAMPLPPAEEVDDSLPPDAPIGESDQELPPNPPANEPQKE